MGDLSRDRNARSSGLAWQKRDNFDRIAGGNIIDDATRRECSLLSAAPKVLIGNQLSLVIFGKSRTSEATLPPRQWTRFSCCAVLGAVATSGCRKWANTE